MQRERYCFLLCNVANIKINAHKQTNESDFDLKIFQTDRYNIILHMHAFVETSYSGNKERQSCGKNAFILIFV